MLSHHDVKMILREDDNPSQEDVDRVNKILSVVDKDIAEIFAKVGYGRLNSTQPLLTQIARHLGTLCANIEKAKVEINNTGSNATPEGRGQVNNHFGSPCLSSSAWTWATKDSNPNDRNQARAKRLAALAPLRPFPSPELTC